MTAEPEGSITRWIGDLKAGGDEAAQVLWERYFRRLVQLACVRLRSARPPGMIEDEEDAALSAFDSFCRGAERGRFPRLSDRNDLWRLLVVITIRKVQDQLVRAQAAKRGGGKDVEGRAFAGSDEAHGNDLDGLTGREPSPELAAMITEEYRRFHDRLGDDDVRRVLDLRLEGYTQEEIAQRLGCSLRTVARRLEYIRRAWLEAV